MSVTLLPDITDNDFDGFEEFDFPTDDHRAMDVTQELHLSYAWDIPSNHTIVSASVVGEKGRGNYILRHNGYINFAETGHVTHPALFAVFTGLFVPSPAFLECIPCLTSCTFYAPLDPDIMPFIYSPITTRASKSATLAQPPSSSEDATRQEASPCSLRVVIHCTQWRSSRSGITALPL
jgi:hypothetical protein